MHRQVNLTGAVSPPDRAGKFPSDMGRRSPAALTELEKSDQGNAAKQEEAL
jgi:hypothetical protein